MRTIKFIIPFLSILIFLSFSANAQLDRSKPPKAKPAPEIEIKKPSTFTLDNGLQVIVAENHEVPMVYFQLAVDVDPVKENDAVGYVNATGQLLRNGTENRTKAEIDEAIDYIGANLYTYTNGIYASVLKSNKDHMLEILADVLINPTFPEEELKKLKQNEISSLAQQKTNASSIARRVGKKLRFKDHPYGEVKTEETIKNITREKVLDYYNTYYKPNTSYLVISGDITMDEAKKAANKYFASWEQGEVPEHKYDFPEMSEGRRVALVNKDDAVQSVISINYPVELKPGDEDAIKARVTNHILGGGGFSAYLMQNLREDKGYTYGAYSSLSNDPYLGHFNAQAEVKGEITDSAVTEFIREMKRIRNEEVDKEHLDLVKNVIYGQFARDMEDPRSYSRYTLNLMRYDLPADYYSNYLKKVEEITIEEVKETAQKYIKPDESIVLVVGNQKEVEDKLKQFDADEQIEIFDKYGNPIEASTTDMGDMTAEEVIDNYIEALGGKKAIQSIKGLKQVYTINMRGQEIESRIYQQKPDKYKMEMLMNGNVMQKQVFDGEKGKMVGMGQEQELQGEQLERLKYESKMHKFLRYDELGVETELVGIEKVNGEDAYKMKVVHANGNKHYDFFDKETGLKVKSQQTISSQGNEMTQVQQFSDYQEINGVKFPFTIEISGMQNMTMKAKNIEVNPGFEEGFFKN